MYGILIALISSIFFPGIITRVKSIASGRKGPVLLQPMRDILRLLKKGNIYSTTTSYIFRLAPIVYFASILGALLSVPFGNQPSIIAFDGDFLFFIYLLGIGKFFMIIAALDTGSCFEGMGASREALYSMLVEPAFFIIMASFAMLTGHTSFHSIFNSLYFDSYLTVFMGILASYNIFQITMIENSRMPYDDPKTHLELTMVHEVMILDYSGFELGLIQYASSLKFVLFSAIISNFFFTPEMPLYVHVFTFIITQILMAIAVGYAESFRARHKMRNNNKAIIILVPISLLIFFSILLIMTNQY